MSKRRKTLLNQSTQPTKKKKKRSTTRQTAHTDCQNNPIREEDSDTGGERERKSGTIDRERDRKTQSCRKNMYEFVFGSIHATTICI